LAATPTAELEARLDETPADQAIVRMSFGCASAMIPSCGRSTGPVAGREGLMRLAVNGTTLWFDVEGAALVPDGTTMRERPIVLALHGGPGLDHAYFKPFLTPLATVSQLIYLDLRGQGRSGQTPLETCTVEQMADDTAAFCRVLGLEHPVVLGHSFGGAVALTLALRHPDLAGRLVLVDTTACWSADHTEALALLEAWHGPAVRAAARSMEGDTSAEAEADFDRLVFPTYVWDPALRDPVMAAVGRSGYVPALAHHYWDRLADAYDLRARLGEIRWPTLVVVGERDWRTPPSASQAIAAGIPGAELVVLPGVAHFPFAEAPEAFTATVGQFVAR
jgi:proline iminopeptidase